jgi:hypothetical protein
MADDGGVLGNLPNSRPGKRSAKRDAGAARPAKSAARAAAKAEEEGAPAAKPRPAPAPGKRTTAVKGGGSGDRVVVDPAIRGVVRHDPVPPSAREDPVGAVVRTAAGVAGAGIKVAGAVTHELLRRLPRP